MTGESDALRLDRTDSLLRDASRCCQEAAGGDLPDAFEANELAGRSWRRLLEASGELCEAMDLLQESSLHRPARTLLRALLETSAYAAWITVRPARYAELLDSSKSSPPFKNVLEVVGWGDEYARSYEPLSDFTHPTGTSLDHYQVADHGTADTPAPEITPSGELYILVDDAGNHDFVSFRPMEKDEAAALYGPYVRFKAFDLVLAGLLAVFGDAAAEHAWWPQTAVGDFLRAVGSEPELGAVMLTRLSAIPPS